MDDATYQTFLRVYAYDRTDLRPHLESVQDAPYGRIEKVTFDAAYNDERVTVYLFLPNITDPPFQTVVYFPTAIPFFTPSSQHLETNEMNFFVRSGRAVLFPVYKGTYERLTNVPYGGPPSVARRDRSGCLASLARPFSRASRRSRARVTRPEPSESAALKARYDCWPR